MTPRPRQSTNTELAKVPVGDLVTRYGNDFGQVLPSHIPMQTFVRLAQGVLRRNAKLRDAAQRNPISFVSALMECARLGHEPGTDQFALVPFRSKDAEGEVEIVGIEQYQGTIERMYRAGGIESVHAEVVYDFELAARFQYETGMAEPIHAPDWYHPNRGNQDCCLGVYAYARMKGGATSRVVYMPRAEVMTHKAVAKKDEFWAGPFWKSMWLKTAVHELEKWVPTSAEYRRQSLHAAASATPAAPMPDGMPPNVDQPHVDPGPIEAEVVTEDWPDPAKPGGTKQ